MPVQQHSATQIFRVSASDGKWTYDLRDKDMSGIVLSLGGEYYYPQQYVMPEDVDTIVPTHSPADHEIRDDYLTQRFTILLPEDDQVYRLQFFNPSLRVYINGTLAGQNGNPGLSWADNEIRKKNFSCFVTPMDGKLEIVTHTAVWNLYEDRAYRINPYLSYAELDYVHPYSAKCSTYLFMGGLFGAALLLVYMFCTNRKWNGNLAFAIACAAMGIIYGTLGQYDHFIDVFPLVSGKTAFYLGCLSVPVMAVCILIYLDRVFPHITKQWLRTCFYALSAVFTGFILFADPRLFTLLSIYYNALTGAMFMYFFIALVVRLRNPYPEQYVSLYGLTVFLVGAVNDILMQQDLFRLRTYSANIIPLVMLLFVLSQLVALYMGNRRVTDEAREAERVARETERQLTADNAMLDRLNRLKTEFLGNVSHELKTPLTVMSGYAQKSGKDLSDFPEFTETERSVRLIGAEADRLALMVSQILDVTRIEEGRMAMNLIGASVMEIVQNTANAYYPIFSKNGNTLDLSGIPDLPAVLCDPHRITQVLVNLIVNATRHTHDGTIAISAEEKDGFVAITVSDNGEGIAAERLANIYDRFNHNKNPDDGNQTGTGLGLFICKHIVEAHGGEILIQSKPGAGTSVTFSMPVQEWCAQTYTPDCG